MILYYLINIALVVVGGVFYMAGGIVSYVSISQENKEWFTFWLGIVVMAVGILLWWLAGSVYMGTFKFPLLGE